MSTAETFALLEAAQSGDEEAGERVLRENTGLIWSVVRRYNGRGRGTEGLRRLGCIGFKMAGKGWVRAFGTQGGTRRGDGGPLSARLHWISKGC